MSNRRKKHALNLLGTFFAEHGLLDARAYKAYRNSVPIRYGTLKVVFGSYSRMLAAFKRQGGELYEMAIGDEATEREAIVMEAREALELAKGVAIEEARAKAAVKEAEALARELKKQKEAADRVAAKAEREVARAASKKEKDKKDALEAHAKRKSVPTEEEEELELEEVENGDSDDSEDIQFNI